MSRMFGLLSGTRLTTAGSSTSLSELDQVSALKESMDALLNNDLIGTAPLMRALIFRSGKDPSKRFEWVP